jgi:hypothetical protein
MPPEKTTKIHNVLGFLLCVAGLTQGAIVTREFQYEPDQFRLSRDRGFDVVLADGMDVTDEPGAPQLPVQPVVIALPGQCRVTAVSFEAENWRVLKDLSDPFPCQRQRVLADTSATDGLTVPDPRIYAEQYPDEHARWTGTSFTLDSTFVQVLVHPMAVTAS